MRVTITFDIDEKTAREIRRCSIERVINTSMLLVEKVDHEDASVNHEDWQEWKPVICTLWGAVSDAIFREWGKLNQAGSWSVRKGEL